MRMLIEEFMHVDKVTYVVKFERDLKRFSHLSKGQTFGIYCFFVVASLNAKYLTFVNFCVCVFYFRI